MAQPRLNENTEYLWDSVKTAAQTHQSDGSHFVLAVDRSRREQEQGLAWLCSFDSVWIFVGPSFDHFLEPAVLLVLLVIDLYTKDELCIFASGFTSSFVLFLLPVCVQFWWINFQVCPVVILFKLYTEEELHVLLAVFVCGIVGLCCCCFSTSSLFGFFKGS